MARNGDTRERLITTAMELMSESSYAGASVDKICETAGVQKGSFYHFFSSKSDLTVDAVECHWENCRAALDKIFSVQEKPLDRLRGLCKWIYESQLEYYERSGRVLGCPLIVLGCELSTQDEQIRLRIQDCFRRKALYIKKTLNDLQAEGLAPGGDTEVEADSILSFLQGRLVHARVRNDLSVLKNLFPVVCRMVGIAQQTATA
jgi:TetR/AcrR family transcriptional repressor of nem operon